MITADKFDLDLLIKDGVRLSHDNRNPSGRTMRRYLYRVVVGGLVLQHFALHQHYSDEQLGAIAEYAKTRAEEFTALQESDVRDSSKAGSFVDTELDGVMGCVANRYRLAHDVNVASVKQLRDMVAFVVEVCNHLRPFAENPNATALKNCPDYQYRGLPSSCADSPWLVSGVDVAGGSGVLEWCVDQSDAEERLSTMMKHSNRFKHLKAESWASLQAA